jgi:Acetyltransferase (GNAT) domain
LLTSTTLYSRALPNGLVLKSIRDLADVERLAAFNGQIHGEEVIEMTRSLILHHPMTRPEHWLYIEDESNSQIVSSLALIPWEWRYEDVTLKAGEMGIVGTLESYRNRGLVRELIVRFKELLRDEAFDLSHIQGIPYFYRQFGYEYALPLETGWHIELRNIPDTPSENLNFRLATPNDITSLILLYNEANANLNISTVRTEAVWRYIFGHTAGTYFEGEVWLILNTEDQIIGYWRINHHGFGTGLIVSETSRLSITAAENLLHWLKAAAIERNKPYIRFNLPVTNDLLRTARGWGASDSGTYAWQIHLVDVAHLLRKLTPVLERRIAASLFAGLTEKIVINLYREAFELDFDGGKLRTVNEIGFQDGGAIRSPPMQFTPLLLGYRSREELTHMYPDVSVGGQARHLVDVLFPRLESFIFSNY